jgi:hypothetical protein
MVGAIEVILHRPLAAEHACARANLANHRRRFVASIIFLLPVVLLISFAMLSLACQFSF